MQKKQNSESKEQFFKNRRRFQKIKRLKDRQIKIKWEIEKVFFKPIIVFVDDLDKFEEKEMVVKIPFAKIPWWNQTINLVQLIIFLGP